MYSVVMAGGSGTRFWPFSRKSMPKQLLSIAGNEPMMVMTCDRLNPLSRDEEMIIVLGREHLNEARKLLKERKIHILAEPVGRNTAACIGLGAIYARHLGCEGAIAFLPADHFIADTPSFLESLRLAEEVAEGGGIVTLGIVPTRPETGYGYIKRAKSVLDSFDFPVYRVSEFVEKPDPERAEKYLASGEYLWNAGIFVARQETILMEIEELLPDLHKGLRMIEESLERDSFEKRLREVYKDLEPVSFDYGIMEKTGSPVHVIPCECGWSDVGSWASLHELRAGEYDDRGNLSEGDTLLIDSRNSYISSRSGRLVACLGLDNCIVIDTDDALLVADLGRAQDIREIVEELKRRKREEIL